MRNLILFIILAMSLPIGRVNTHLITKSTNQEDKGTKESSAQNGTDINFTSKNLPAYQPTPFRSYQTNLEGRNWNSTFTSNDNLPIAASTFLGAHFSSFRCVIAVGKNLSIYGACNADETDTGISLTPGSFDLTHNGKTDIYVFKLNPSASVLEYGTFIGGNDDDQVYDISVDSHGSAYILGVSNSDNFPTTPNALANSIEGSSDCFLLKLDSEGMRLNYSTYINSENSGDVCFSLEIDDAGSTYVIGQTYSFNFPVTAWSFQDYYQGSSDAFILKIDSVGSKIEYGTFLGSRDDDYGVDIGIDQDGNILVTGMAGGQDFPISKDAYQKSIGKYPLFLSKLSPDLSKLLCSTFLGGSEVSYNGSAASMPHSMDLGPDGSVYIVGRTHALDFPTTEGAFDRTTNGGDYFYGTPFLSRINSTCSELIFSTFVGGRLRDIATSVAVDSRGRVHVSGETYPVDFPTTPNAIFPNPIGGIDAFLLVMNATGTDLVYSTFLGGSNHEQLMDSIMDNDESVYLIGFTLSPDFPINNNAFKTNHNGWWDTYITKIKLLLPGNPLLTNFSYIPFIKK